MKRLTLASAVFLLTGSWLLLAGPAAEKTVKVELNGHTFTLPPGFEIELVAGPPLVNRPITADFDEQGRLYVSDSSGSNEPVAIQLKKKPHRILRLEDSDGDGRFDKSTVFAAGVMFPEGTMWYDGSLYVAAPPTIWKMTDTDGDGVADQRSEWFQGKTLTGCANDLHGPYLGPDGWIYWCKGAFAKQVYERPGKPTFRTRASHIFRCRPDGSGLEVVMTGGMDNPVDLVFTPGGERIFTSTFIQRPGGGLRDGLVHAIYGGVYGKEYEVNNEHKWTGPNLMPPLAHLGAAAPCGFTSYDSRVFGTDYQDNLFACLFNMHKITRHILQPQGSSFKTRDEDFLVSSNFDFHPTDILEDADGSLLVVDTGGWYKLCCPTSQLYKPDVLGGIYRVRRKGAARPQDPRGLKLDWAKLSTAELARLLDDPRPAVKRRAVATLASRGLDALAPLAKIVRSSPSAEARRNAVWTACRIESPKMRALVRSALDDKDETVRQAAIHSVSVWRDGEAVPQLLGLLKSTTPHNQRAAAEALGRTGDRSILSELLEAAGKPLDRGLEHSIIYALIEIEDPERTATGLMSHNPHIRRAALTAIDQIGSRLVRPDVLAKEFASTDAKMKEAAWWIAGRHPEWGKDLAHLLLARLRSNSLSPAEQEELASKLARFSQDRAIQDLLSSQLESAEARPQTQRLVLKAMAQSALKEVPQSWIDALVHVLKRNQAEVIPEAVMSARSLRIVPKQAGNISQELMRLGQNGKLASEVRLAALAAVPAGLPKLPPNQFAFLLAHLDREKPVLQRSLAAEVLSRARLGSEQLLSLASTLKSVGPMEVDKLLEAFSQSGDDKVGLGLLANLQAAPIRTALRAEMLKPRLAKFGPAVHKQAEELYTSLDADALKQKARLEELLPLLKDGDINRGHVVFNSPKAACSACHAIGYLGGNVGPDLTRIGKIRTERDLLESIVFPSASFVRSYESVTIATKEGKVINGLIRKDAPDELVLATGINEEVRIAREAIEEIQPSRVSIMPAGLEQQLTPREIADLVKFLKACQ